MDVEGLFDHVCHARHAQRIAELRIEDELICWIESCRLIDRLN